MVQQERTVTPRSNRRAYYQAHRSEVLAKRRAYRLAHKDMVEAQQRAYREAHHEEYLEYQRQYYQRVLKLRRRAKQAAS